MTRCLDLTDGRMVWEHRVPAPFDSVIFPARRLGKSPRATPLHADGRLYTLGVGGDLTCFDAATGRVAWRRDFRASFPTPMPICGASLSPLVDGPRIYVHAGHDDRGAIFALDRQTGREIWNRPGEGPGYTSPILATFDGRRMLVTAAHNSWLGLAPETGALLWSHAVRRSPFNHQSITPVVAGGLLVCGANQRPTLGLRPRRVGEGWVVDRVWENAAVTMSTASPVAAGGLVYALNEKTRGQLVALDPGTGRTAWSCPGGRGEHVTLYAAGELVLVFSMSGDLLVQRRGAAGELREIARYAVADGVTWSSPAVAGGLLLVKGGEQLALWALPGR